MRWRHAAPPATAPTPAPGERGTGLIGRAAGVAVFLVFMLFAVQLCVNLYATSTVTAAGYDAARSVASHRVDHADPAIVAGARRRAEARLRHLLGDVGRDAEVRWTVDDQSVRLHLRVQSPTILPRSVAGEVAMGTVDRTFEVRIEQPR